MYLYQRIAKEKERQAQIEKMFPPSPPPKPDRRYVGVMGSMSHTYGNVLAFIQHWILNLFPKDLFKTIHVNSKIAHRQIRSTTHEYLKKASPMIIFRPRFADHDEDRFLKGTQLIERQVDIYNTWGETNLQPFFQDLEKDIEIKYQLNRSVMYIDVILIFSTEMQQLNYFHMIENKVRIEHPMFLETFLESYIPQEMLKVLGDCVEIPLYDSHGNTKEFLDYMNGKSGYPITYKLQGSTQTREFYRYYPANIDTIITNFDKDTGEKIGSVSDHYNISFTVRLEFNSTGFYYIFSNNIYDLHLPPIDYGNNSEIIPLFTDVFDKCDLHLQQGWILYNRCSCRLSNENDAINFDQMLNESIREALSYHKKNGLLVQDFIDFKLRKQGEPIHEGKEYTIDWDKKLLKFHRQNTYSTYTVMLCINLEYINNLIKILYKLK